MTAGGGLGKKTNGCSGGLATIGMKGQNGTGGQMSGGCRLFLQPPKETQPPKVTQHKEPRRAAAAVVGGQASPQGESAQSGGKHATLQQGKAKLSLRSFWHTIGVRGPHR